MHALIKDVAAVGVCMNCPAKRSLGYRLTDWLLFLCGQMQRPRPDVMPDRKEGIARVEGFVAAV